MAYNLAKYKFQPGQRVEINDRGGFGLGKRHRDGVLVADWPDGCKTGTIVRLWKPYRSNEPPWIIVTPDEGFGEFMVKPIDIHCYEEPRNQP